MATNRYVDGTYLTATPDWHASDSPWKAAEVLRMIGKHRLFVPSIGDLGCGVGEVLVELQKKLPADTALTGYDISPQAIAIAKMKENSTLRFLNADFMSSAPPFPDLLLLLDVFEHVQDYIGFLDALRRRTDWIIFHIPIDINALNVIRKSSPMLKMRQQYGHLHYFTKQTALATLSDIGYNVVDCFYTDDLAIVGIAPKAPVKRIYYELRRWIARTNEDLAASLFNSFNLMVLAQGDRATPPPL